MNNIASFLLLTTSKKEQMARLSSERRRMLYRCLLNLQSHKKRSLYSNWGNKKMYRGAIHGQYVFLCVGMKE